MNKIPSVKPKKLLKILLKYDFYIHHQKGSHVILKHKIKSKLRVTIPLHNKDLKVKTLLSILKQTDLDESVFIRN